MRQRSRIPRRSEIRAIAGRILADHSDPVVRIRLLRGVLGVRAGNSELVRARRRLTDNPWVAGLLEEQRGDGGWGRLHSRDSRIPCRISTTEFGVERALALGLGPRHPALCRAARHLHQLLAGAIPVSDPPEVNDRWPTGVRLFAASTLALVRPSAPALRPVRRLWLRILRHTFASGDYDASAENSIHRQLTGASAQGSYLTLDGKYQLRLLTARAADIAAPLQRAWLDWLMARPAGIGYLSVPLGGTREPTTPGSWDRWLASIELLIGLPAARERLRSVIAWLWDTRDGDGFYDLGPRPAGSVALPLSASWRRAGQRRVDWTVRVLCLLARFRQPHGTG